MITALIFDPLLPWFAIFGVAGFGILATTIALLKGLTGWGLRGLASILIVVTLVNPTYQRENRTPLPDIVLLIEDESTSQSLGRRSELTAAAAEAINQEIGQRPGTEVRRIRVSDGDANSGTQLMTAVSDALAEEPRDQVAGVIVITDGQIHDAKRAPMITAPFNVLLTGERSDWDRRLIVNNAPTFAVIGEPTTLNVRIDDIGSVPQNYTDVTMRISINGDAPINHTVPVGDNVEIPISLPHAGQNVLQVSVAAADDEITSRNNTALIRINGVRDRLRVLLVSGVPHQGGRTWRNLLKSDSSVDLVHFTILRPPDKQDGVLVNELSLIAFPTRELFLEKIADFDLIIFDRYKRRGILPAIYLENVAEYVRNGGAVLVAAGPDFATADSIYRSPLSSVLPGEPTARIFEDRYKPVVTDLGKRHPVTSQLPDADQWGSWLRQIDVEAESGHTVMTGLGEQPLLILDRVDRGRVALLASDHAWLWSRGFNGGGPQLELLRRLAHWMMREPELEEETLVAEADGRLIRIIRRTLDSEIGPIKLTQPSGENIDIDLKEIRPGWFESTYEGSVDGLYRLAEGTHSTVVGLGPASPTEFEDTISTEALLAPIVAAHKGGILRLEDGLPSLRFVRNGRPAAGRDWIGLSPRNAYTTTDIHQSQLLPAWLMLMLIAALILLGWLREGRA
ncbi:MAG: hypothetical protein OXC63_02820 [Aestuariivita sp.]|nr:hypothetical protein [Aestuariivita sp.]MCY4345191.1 hypothetical protein [Aestuariivita sp.]